MDYYLGLLGLSSVSKCALVAEDGKIVTAIPAPPLAIRVNANIKFSLRRTFSHLARKVGNNSDELLTRLKGACVAMSGVYQEADKLAIGRILRQIGFTGEIPLVVCENVNANLAANGLDQGGVVRAGTGAMVYLKGKGMDEPIRVDGWGSDIGDFGGGYHLGLSCLQAMFLGRDRRKPNSSDLERAILDHVGLSPDSHEVEDLVQWYYDVRRNDRWRVEISNLAAPIRMMAEDREPNDELAVKLMNRGARHLAKTLKTALERAEDMADYFEGASVPLLLAGGLLRDSAIYMQTIQEVLAESGSHRVNWRLTWPQYRPFVGTLLLAVSGRDTIDRDNPLNAAIWKSAQQQGYSVDERGN